MNRQFLIILVTGSAGALAVIAACGSFSGSDTVATDAGAPVDAASSVDGGTDGKVVITDASMFSCSLFPGAFLCADFDETAPTAFMGGSPFSLPMLLDGSAVIGPYLSAPAAFWSERSDVHVNANGNKKFIYIHASFRIRFDAVKSGVGSFARLSITPQCTLNLKQEKGPDRIGIDTHCGYGAPDGGDYYDHADVLKALPLPDVWYEAELTADYANATAIGGFGSSTVTMGLSPAAKPGGVPTASFGPDFAANRIGIDNIIVDVH